MQGKTTNLNEQDRAILCRYADFRLNDQIQSMRQLEVDSSIRDGALFISTNSGRKVLARKKSIL